jgi:hypothetical protein
MHPSPGDIAQDGRTLNQDQEQLRLLSIFHYVIGGLMALAACLPIIHLCFGIAMIVQPDAFKGNRPEQDFPLQAFGWFFVAFASVAILIGWTCAVLVVVAGRNLARHRHYTFCIVIAAVACMFVPLGTILGVFTIIVLLRPSVKALFEQASADLQQRDPFAR